MARKGALHKARKLRASSTNYQEITIGEVVATNDPQQMGRLRVLCPLFGDDEDTPISDIPWCTGVSPLAGTTYTPARGRGTDQTAGQISYGMFNIPKVGASVMVTCIDGDPRFRIWLGCVNDQFLTHTMPHGRYSYQTENQPEGPFSSSEDKIQPLYDSQTAAFTNIDTGVDPRMSFEFRTRAADKSVAGLKEKFTNTEDSIISQLADDTDVEYENNPNPESSGKYKNTQGYPRSRIEPGVIDGANNEPVLDPQTYAWTTPGFHSLSMQDNSDNCRVRFRTTHGHQIIMDDTNERIYISTAGGKTWIEMDEVGNIDIYGERNISVHAKKDINFNAGGSFNVHAEEDVNISSANAVQIHAGAELHLKTDAAAFLHSEDDMNVKCAGGTMFIEGFTDTNILAGGNVLVTGTEVHLNGPPATAATEATDAQGVSRKPDHEPWARTMILDDGNPEFAYDSPDVGRKENGEDLGRNPKWHR